MISLTRGEITVLDAVAQEDSDRAPFWRQPSVDFKAILKVLSVSLICCFVSLQFQLQEYFSEAFFLEEFCQINSLEKCLPLIQEFKSAIVGCYSQVFLKAVKALSKCILAGVSLHLCYNFWLLLGTTVVYRQTKLAVAR